jgi:hypothetical protein
MACTESRCYVICSETDIFRYLYVCKYINHRIHKIQLSPYNHYDEAMSRDIQAGCLPYLPALLIRVENY